MRVLIIDDNAALCESLQVYFQDEGHVAEFAVTHDAAVAMDPETYDLLLIDYVLDKPHRGTEIAEKAQKPDVVMMSGYLDLARLVKLHERWTFMSKPVYRESILGLLREVATG